MADDVTINIRTRGARQTSHDAKQVSRDVTGIGRAGEIASAGLRNLRRNTNLGSTSMYVLHRGAFAAGAGIAAIGALSIRAGLQFNASMEQNQVAFAQFLGGSQAARKELAFLYKEAAATPFEVPQITSAARRLLAFGFSLKSTNSWLGTIGDTIAGMGGGAQEIDQLVTAIGQIRSKGRLQGDELMQLSELGVVDRKKLAKDLGITPLELMSGNSNISGDKALRALKKQFDAAFGGQSAKQAKTFNGQMSTLHDNLNMTLGTITKPGFDWLRGKGLPALGKSTGEIDKIFGRKDLDLGQKITLSRQSLKRNLGPFADQLEAEIKAAHLGDKLETEFEHQAPHLVNAAGRIGTGAAKAFVIGWWHAGFWGKLVTGLYLGSKLGAFGGIGRIAGGKFGRGFIFGAIGAAAAYEAGKAAVNVIGGGPVRLGSESLAAQQAADADPATKRARARARLLQRHPEAISDFYRRHPGDRALVRRYNDISSGPLLHGAAGLRQSAESDRIARTLRAHGDPQFTSTPVVIVKLNGREIARAVDRQHADDKARGRR